MQKKCGLKPGLTMALIPALLVFLQLGPALATPVIDELAPDFTAKDTYLKTFTLSKARGKYVVLEWTNHECPFVRKHYGSGNMQALQRKMTEAGVIWVSIISSAEGKQGYVEDSEANTIADKRGAAPTHIIRDTNGRIGHLYQARTTPHMFLITPKRKLVYMGAIDSIPSTDPDDIPKAENYLVRAFNEAQTGIPVTASATRSYGCSIKYKDSEK